MEREQGREHCGIWLGTYLFSVGGAVHKKYEIPTATAQICKHKMHILQV